MRQNKVVEDAILSAIDEVNLQLPKAQRLSKARDTALLGPTGRLDSLGLVNLIVAAESQIQEQLGVTISLADEQAMSQQQTIFESVGTLVDYVSACLDREGNDATEIQVPTPV